MSDAEPRLAADAIPPGLVARARAHAARGDADVIEDAFPDEAERTVEMMRERRWSARVPQRFVRARLSDLDEPIASEIWSWATAPGGRNLVVLGPIGTGKSHAAVAALRPAHDVGLVVSFWPIVELFAALRPGDEQIMPGEICEADRIVIDDLGTERLTDWSAEMLYLIVNRRWLDEAPTIFTSNLAPADLAEAVGARMFSRIADGAVTIWLSGSDRRRGC
jgi:DNA replication protein DnaC